MLYTLFYAVKLGTHTRKQINISYGSRLTYARMGVSLYDNYSHMRVAAGMECVYKSNTRAGIFYRRLSGEIIGCAKKWRIHSFWWGKEWAVPGAVRSGGTVFALRTLAI